MHEATYLAAVHGRPGNYGILFPDFLGCVSSGETVEAALRSGHDALQFHVDGMVDDGDPIPPPAEHSLDSVAETFTVAEDSDPDDWVGLMPITVAIAIAADMTTVKIKSEVVREIAALVQSNLEHLSTSQFIERAARRELARLKKSA